MLTCPQCKKDAYPVCSNNDCICHRRIPEGEKPLIDRPMFFRFIIPRKLFNSLWHFVFDIKINPHNLGLYELEECPYCGFRELMDFWEDREMEQSFQTAQPK